MFETWKDKASRSWNISTCAVTVTTRRSKTATHQSKGAKSDFCFLHPQLSLGQVNCLIKYYIVLSLYKWFTPWAIGKGNFRIHFTGSFHTSLVLLNKNTLVVVKQNIIFGPMKLHWIRHLMIFFFFFCYLQNSSNQEWPQHIQPPTKSLPHCVEALKVKLEWDWSKASCQLDYDWHPRWVQCSLLWITRTLRAFLVLFWKQRCGPMDRQCEVQYSSIIRNSTHALYFSFVKPRLGPICRMAM